MMKRLKHIGIVFATIIIVLAGFVIWVLYSHSALKIALKTTKQLLAPQHILIQYQGVNGHVTDFTLQYASFNMPHQFKAVAHHINIQWRPWDLLRQHVAVNAIHAQLASVTLASPQQPLPSQHTQAQTHLHPHSQAHWTVAIQQAQLPQLHVQLAKNTVSGQVNFNLSQQTWQIQLNADKLNLHRWNPQLPKQAQFKLNSHSNGQRQHTALALTSSTAFNIHLKGHGQLQQHTWTNTIETLQLQIPMGSWTLKTPTQLSIHSGQATLQPLCLYDDHNKLCLSDQVQRNGWAFSLNTNTLNLADFIYTQQPLRLAGTGQVKLHLIKQNHTISGGLQTTWQHVVIQPQQQASVFQKSHYLKIQKLAWHLIIKPHTLGSQFALLFNPTNQLNWNLLLTHWKQQDPLAATAKINSVLQSHLQNLNVFNYVIPYMSNLTGELNTNFHITGTLAKPLSTGQFQLKHAQIALPTAGLTLQHIQLHLTSKANQIHLNSSMQSGKGHLTINGFIQPPLTTPKAHFTINSKHLTVLDTPAIKMTATSQLQFTANDRQTQLNGHITIPFANINGDLAKGSVQTNPDIVFVNNRGQIIQQHHSLPFALNLQVKLGKNVSFKGFGIKTHITGQVHMLNTAGNPTMGTGQLQLIDGSYAIYGKSFTVSKHSYIVFDNSLLTDPAFNITAMYQINPLASGSNSFTKLQAGVHLTGTVNHPKLTLFSKPSMSQSQILSYIVMGQPIQDVQSNTTPLAQAALILLERGGSATVLDTLQNTLGIDNISVGTLQSTPSNSQTSNTGSGNASTGATDDTAVFVGKNLGRRLSIGYGHGIVNQEQEVTSSLILNRYFTLNANAGANQTGADLLFNINF